MGSGRVRVPEALAGRGGERPLPTFDVPYFKYIDEEDEEDEWSSRSQSSTEDDSGDSLLSDRYVVVSGTPEKILEHLLSDLHLEAAQDKETGKERAWRGGGRAWGWGEVPVPVPAERRGDRSRAALAERHCQPWCSRGMRGGTPERGAAAGRCRSGTGPKAGAPAVAEPLGSNLKRVTFGFGCRRGSAGCGGLCTAPSLCRLGCHLS